MKQMTMADEIAVMRLDELEDEAVKLRKRTRISYVLLGLMTAAGIMLSTLWLVAEHQKHGLAAQLAISLERESAAAGALLDALSRASYWKGRCQLEKGELL